MKKREKFPNGGSGRFPPFSAFDVSPLFVRWKLDLGISATSGRANSKGQLSNHKQTLQRKKREKFPNGGSGHFPPFSAFEVSPLFVILDL
jgi:hypothetical protein